MKPNKAEQNALITLMNRLYQEIRVIEEQQDLRVDAQDFRPRIEYFHDAVRMLTSGAHQSSRLSVEFLAYDISMLRHIQGNPLRRSKNTKKNLSPGTALKLFMGGDHEASGSNAAVRSQLADLYKQYTMLFAALFAEPAEQNYQTRVNECNTSVEELAAVEHELKNKSGKDVDLAALMEQCIDDPDMLQALLKQLRAHTKGKMSAQAAKQTVKDMMTAADKQIKTIEQAHFTYTTTQLAIYENSRDMVKKMAGQGLNLVGNFVQNAVQEAQRGGNRGI